MSNQHQDATIPGYFPTQDGVDRSNHLAVILSIELDPWEAMDEGFDWEQLQKNRPDYRVWIEKAQADISNEFPIREFDLEHYQVGPAAGGMMDNVQMIATIIQHASAIYGAVELGRWAIQLTRGIKRRATEWKNEQDYDSLEVREAFPPLMLKYMALGYLMEFHEYEPRDEILIECLSKEFFAGYTSPAHPTSAVEYLIVAPTKHGSYRLRISGDSRIHSLQHEALGQSVLLPTLPYLNDSVEVQTHDQDESV